MPSLLDVALEVREVESGGSSFAHWLHRWLAYGGFVTPSILAFQELLRGDMEPGTTEAGQ